MNTKTEKQKIKNRTVIKKQKKNQAQQILIFWYIDFKIEGHEIAET